MVDQIKKIGCLIYSFGEKYEKIATCAVKSFKKFHPDVTLFHINEANREDYRSTQLMNVYGQGIYKYMLAYEIMKKYKYDKIIILGADTITCSRLDEFIDNNEDDVLVTLSYPVTNTYSIFFGTTTRSDDDWCYGCPENTLSGVDDYNGTIVGIPTLTIDYKKENKIFEEQLCFNSDVACFNNLLALEKTIACSIGHQEAFLILFKAGLELHNDAAHLNRVLRGLGTCRADVEAHTGEHGAEDAGLNLLCTISIRNATLGGWDSLRRPPLDYNFKIRCVDAPYETSSVVYNMRSKGNTSAMADEKPWGPFINKWKVNDDKIYDSKGKQIKIYHYGEALGILENDDLGAIMNQYIFHWFNEDTKKFFREQCDCEDFFEKEFKIG